MKSYSQCGEDLWLDEHVFHQRRGGTFVEVGVGVDGYKDSNTAFFEVFRGWTGWLFEPVVESASAVAASRKSQVFCMAVGESDDYAVIGIDRDNPDLSGIRNNSAERRKVDCRTLARVLGGFSVDLLSIDTEGTELDVLRSNDWTRYQPRAIIVEHTTVGIEGDQKQPLRDYLEPLGYTMVHETRYNLIFTR